MKYFLILGVTVYLCLIGSTTYGQGDSKLNYKVSVSNLLVEDMAVRVSAKQNLIQLREDVARSLLQELSALSKERDRTFQSRLHVVIELLGVWRIEDAVIPLLGIVDYELDSATFPVGDKLPISAYFPAAQSLAQIGGPILSKAIVNDLVTKDNERVQRVELWIMNKAYGSQEAQALLDAALSKTVSPSEKKRLGKATKLLTQGDMLLSLDHN